jgi:predicted Zn-dependent protease
MRLAEGRALLAQRRPEAALGPLSEGAAAMPENADIQVAYARALWATGSREEALSRFEIATRLGNGRFRTEYVSALLESGRTADARRLLEETLQASPQDPQALETLGQLHNREGRPAEAVVLLTRLAALRPNDPQMVAHLGYALERSGNPERAAEIMTQVVASVPASTIARELLAEAQFKQGKREEAVAVVRQGLEQKPDSPELQRRLGSLLERSGQAGEAAAAYREYLRLAPQASDAKELAERATYLERVSSTSSSTS